jgi:2'-5' RNA ligase
MKESEVRLFIALPVSEEVKEKAGEIIRALRTHDTDTKWVAPANLHLTIKFLGNTENTALPHISRALTQIATTYEPFYIKIYGTGTFPDKRNPRIIWIGAGVSDIILRLRNDIEHSMESLGCQRETKRFHPHLTIGRVRSRTGVKSLLAGIEKYRSFHFGDIYIDFIELMKSDLKPQGAEYTCIHKAFMKEREN